MEANSALVLHFDPQVFTPIIQAVVTETLSQLEVCRQQIPDARLAFSEPEAAALLGLAVHQLRDERRRGRIGASAIVGRRIRYVRQDLVDYLARRRVKTDQFDTPP